MISDLRTTFATAQDGTSETVGDVVDLGATPTLRSLSSGAKLCIRVVEGFDVAATFTLESDSTADLATSPTIHFSTGAVADADLGAGTVVAVVPLPPRANYERFLGVRCLPGEGATTGTYSANLVFDAAVSGAYPDSVGIS